MKLSVLICTRNRPQDVKVCLPTVLACLQEDWEVVLVDQSDNDETRAVVQSLGWKNPPLVYLPTQTVGKSRALNLGLAHVQGEILAFTDDDCEAPSDWLIRILEEFEQSPGADILFGPVLPSPSIPDLHKVCVPAWTFGEARDLRPNELCGMGANMALRRDVLSRLPGAVRFDPALGPGALFPAGEEGDFVYRLRRQGARAALRPSLRLYHRAFRMPDHWGTVLRGYGIGDAAFLVKHARCGDFWAIRNLAERALPAATRAFAKWLLRRRPNSDAAFFRGLWQGLASSLRLRVDPQTRLYRLAPEEQPTQTLAVRQETRQA